MRKRLLSALPPLSCAVYLFYPVLRPILLPFGVQLLPPDLVVTLSVITVAGCILCLLCADLSLPDTRAVRLGRILACPACLLNAVCFSLLWAQEEMELPLVAIAATCGGICALIPLFTAGPLRDSGFQLKVILPLLTALFCVSLAVSAHAQLERAERLWTIEEYPSPGGSQTVTVRTQNMEPIYSGAFINIHVYERPLDRNIGIGFLRAREEEVYFSGGKFPRPASVSVRWNDAHDYTIVEHYAPGT